MTEYQVELNTGKAILIKDARSLADLAATLCDDGFLQVLRAEKGGYQPSSETTVMLFERAVLSIEPA
ncbi:MAG: hypothetical protein ACOH2L_00015 [Devosia sp.]